MDGLPVERDRVPRSAVLDTEVRSITHRRASDGYTTGTNAAGTLEALVASLTTAEKVSLVVGATAWTTTAIERIGLRSIRVSDGPVGVRGAETSDETTSAMMPAPSALSATWDVDLAARVGELFAAEARRHDVDVALAPQCNLQRTPVGGRHFECYSEDPHLTAEIGVALVRAAQRQGVSMCAKHFVANDSETERTTYRSRVDERTLREVYLAPFERLVTEGGVWTVMGAYSGVDDDTTAAPVLEHRPLLTGVLKQEWGFDGLVLSDWVATQSIGPAVRGGLDLQMPGPDGVWGDGLTRAVQRDDVAEGDLDDKVLRLLRLAERVGALGDASPPRAVGDPTGGEAARERASQLLREFAARAIVVLKDDAGLVPLDPGPLGRAERAVRIALVGPAATRPFLQGGGSSFVVPDHITTPAVELGAALPEGCELVVVGGARARLRPPPIDIAATVTDPDTGAAGVRLELVDGAGTVLRSWIETTWDGWLRNVGTAAASVRVRGDIHFDDVGEHELGFGTVGAHEVRIDHDIVSADTAIADEHVVLNSECHHPAITTVRVAAPRTVTLEADLQVVHTVGYGSFSRCVMTHRAPGPSPDDELADAVAAAAAADVVVAFVGTTEEVESEGFDRTGLDLPGNQDEMVRRVLAVNPRTIVIVNAGAPVVLPWFDVAPTVLWAWLGGQEAGTAVADVLTGITEPSGRLPWTLPARAVDVPVPHAVPHDGIVDYVEGLDVGYRAWERTGRRPAAPFGHGLGWTAWEYVEACVTGPGGDADRDLHVDVTVRNVGPRDGLEVVQVYVEPGGSANGDVARPVRWLGGFALADVAAGASATVGVRIPARAFQVWDRSRAAWSTPGGGHRLRIGRSVRDLRIDLDLADPANARANLDMTHHSHTSSRQTTKETS
ncbi:glycoside hydrolase family 3 C-terminal domain-containing protein [soil metagenome]